MLRAQYLENSWRYYLATIASSSSNRPNYYIACCDAVRSASLATSCLLVFLNFLASEIRNYDALNLVCSCWMTTVAKPSSIAMTTHCSLATALTTHSDAKEW